MQVSAQEKVGAKVPDAIEMPSEGARVNLAATRRQKVASARILLR